MPLKYYGNNVGGTTTLLKAMDKAGVKQIGKPWCHVLMPPPAQLTLSPPISVFSSSATVYGTSPSPLTESSDVGVGITNPYGMSKYIVERVMKDLYKSDDSWGIVLLRYFNPVGAHER